MAGPNLCPQLGSNSARLGELPSRLPPPPFFLCVPGATLQGQTEADRAEAKRNQATKTAKEGQEA